MLAPGVSAMTVAQTAAMPAVQCAPHQEATLQRVIVNGQVVLDRGHHTGALPGKVLRHGQGGTKP